MSCNSVDFLPKFNNGKKQSHNLMRAIHVFVFLMIIGLIAYEIINGEYYKNYGNIYIGAILAALASSLFSFLLSSAIMLLPSYFFVKKYFPRLYVCDDLLVFDGGSRAVDYGSWTDFFPFFIYILGDFKNETIPISNITNISPIVNRGLNSFSGAKYNLKIEAKEKVIVTCGWMSELEIRIVQDKLLFFLKEKGIVLSVQRQLSPDTTAPKRGRS